MTQLLVFLLLGLANGAVFASLALALVVTFRSSGVINFATGSIALFSAYTYGFLRQGQLFDPIPGLPTTVHLSNGMGFVPAAALALAITAVIGLLLYAVVFRPMRTAPAVARAVAALGVTVLLTGLIQQRVGDTPVNVAAIFPSTNYKIGSVLVSGDRVWFAVTVVAVALVLAAAYRFTRFGLHTRAAAETEKGAYVSGISPDRIAAVIRGTTSSAQYGGRGICYLEFGADQVALVDVTFFGDQRVGELVGPSEALAADKAEFGSSRIKRWFGREWTAT